MRALSRSAIALVLALLFGAVTGLAPAQAVTAVIMGGTGQPDPTQVPGYLNTVTRLYISPVTNCQVGSCQLHPTVTPEEFFPLFTGGMTFGKSYEAGLPLLDTDVRQLLDAGEQVVVFGYSQSATLVTEEKRALAADPSVDPDQLQYVVIGNPNRPNGGFLQRFFPSPIPVVEYTPTTSDVDTQGPQTTDISFQYDIASDFPRYPANLLTMLNTVLGNWIHGSYPTSHDGYSETDLLTAIANPVYRQVVGNTTYITLPTKVLPLAQAIRDTGYTLGLSAIALPLADLLEPTLRVLVELGYDRTVSHGTQTSFGMFPAVDPGKLVTDLVAAAGQGLSDAVTGIIARTTPPAPAPVTSLARSSAPEISDTSDTVETKIDTAPVNVMKRVGTVGQQSDTADDDVSEDDAPETTAGSSSNDATDSEDSDTDSSEDHQPETDTTPASDKTTSEHASDTDAQPAKAADAA